MSNADILATLPPGTTRVLVVGADGRRQYKPVAELTDDDVIQTRPSDGAATVWQAEGGRPSKTSPTPAADLGAAYQTQMGDHVRKDGIVTMLRRDSDDPRLLSQVAQEIGADIARLDFLRTQLEPTRRSEAADLTVKRIRALAHLHEKLSSRLDRLNGGAQLDPKSPAVKEVVRAMLECTRESMTKAGMKQEAVDSVFSILGRALSDPSWETHLRARMQKAAQGV